MWNLLSSTDIEVPVTDEALFCSAVLATLVADIPHAPIIPLKQFSTFELRLYAKVVTRDTPLMEKRLQALSHRELAALFGLADFLDVPDLFALCPKIINEKIRDCPDHEIADAVQVYFGSLGKGKTNEPQPQ